jgi:foldase protein PrsA
MSGRARLMLVLFAILFVGLFVGFAIAQGIGEPSVPSGDVAIVKDVPSDVGTISEADFRRALLQQATQAKLKKPPQPGDSKYEKLKATTMRELLNEAWIRGEAEELGISVTEKQVETKLAQIKKQNFSAKGAYQKFLKESHFTEEDVNNRIELQELSTQVQEVISSAAGPASNAEIADYYEAEKATQFTTPASRDVRVIVNEDKSKVEQAKAALEKDNSPASWKKVAAKYSSDPTTKTKGGLQPGITEEFVKGDLKSGIFDSTTGELVGPIKYEKNYLLLEVVKLNPEKVKSLGEVRSQISSTLTQQKQQEFLTEFVSGFQAKWTSRTFCAADFATEQCANFVSSGHPSTAPPACYEADPKTPATECPAPVAQAVPALPGTVTVVKPKGEPFPQRPRPETTESAAGGEAGATVPEGATPGPEPSGE